MTRVVKCKDYIVNIVVANYTRIIVRQYVFLDSNFNTCCLKILIPMDGHNFETKLNIDDVTIIKK